MTTDATDNTKYASKTGTTDCITDFIVFMNGQDNAVANGPPADRYCGTAFNPAAAATSATVCCKFCRIFPYHYILHLM